MRLRTRLSGVARWLFVEPHVVWVAVLAPIAAIYAARILPIAAEARIRVAGFAMTLLGVVLVVKAIVETEALFGRPTVRSRAKEWFLRLLPLLGRSRVISARASITIAGPTVSARGYVRVPAGGPLSLQSRVDAIEENLKRIDQRITDAEERIDRDIGRVVAQLSTERNVRQRAVDALGKRLEDYSSGDLDWEMVGAFWVVVGQALGSFQIAHALFH